MPVLSVLETLFYSLPFTQHSGSSAFPVPSKSVSPLLTSFTQRGEPLDGNAI